jgi:hypothetical protein
MPEDPPTGTTPVDSGSMVLASAVSRLGTTVIVRVSESRMTEPPWLASAAIVIS